MKKIIVLVAALLNGCAVYTTPEGEAALGGLIVGAAVGALIYGGSHGCHNCYRHYNHPRPYYRPRHYRY